MDNAKSVRPAGCLEAVFAFFWRPPILDLDPRASYLKGAPHNDLTCLPERVPTMAEQPRAGIIGSDFERLVTEYNKALANGEARPISAICDGTEASACESERTFRKLLEAFPAPVYTTDAAGRITFYNEAAVQFAGRRARLGTDQWCVTWRLYWPDGTPLPHDECPMAIALKEDRVVRGTQAVAERLDGTRVPFIPHPTPLRDASGALVGAVNMLLEIDEVEQVALDGVQVLIVSDDIFMAADLDLLIDEAGGVAVAIAATGSEALALLGQRPIDATLVSLPLRDGHGPLIDALVRQNIPFVLHEGNEEQVVQMLGDALTLRGRGNQEAVL
jgi:PAS domain S-box-containing protein